MTCLYRAGGHDHLGTPLDPLLVWGGGTGEGEGEVCKGKERNIISDFQWRILDPGGVNL